MQNFHKYLSTGEAEEKWGFYVTTIGHSKTEPHRVYPHSAEHPNDHTFSWNRGRILNGYYLVFISKGRGHLQTALTPQQELSEGSLFFLYPGVWHRYKPDAATGWEEYWIGFRGHYPQQLMMQGFFPPEQPLSPVPSPSALLRLFQQAIDTAKEAEEGYNQVLSGLALQMLALLHSFRLKEGNGEGANRLIPRARFLLQEAIDRPVRMEGIAGELSVSYSSFRKRFKEATGLSPNQYLLQLRLQKAKDLLLSTHLTVQEIAEQTGFDSPHYFSKHFKQKHGASPVAFRKKNG